MGHLTGSLLPFKDLIIEFSMLEGGQEADGFNNGAATDGANKHQEQRLGVALDVRSQRYQHPSPAFDRLIFYSPVTLKLLLFSNVLGLCASKDGGRLVSVSAAAAV